MSNLQPKHKSQMTDKERVQDFQRKLYRKAKQEKDFCFYVLYDKVRLRHFLREAYRRCKINGGCAGVDEMTFEMVETYGVDRFLEEIIKELEDKKYKPKPVLRVEIPKENGKSRLLGIPVIKDRVIQMAVKLVIEPIFEADFEEDSYGFRPKRDAKQAVSKIKENLLQGKTEILDADLQAYFDTIPHKELMKLISLRISDKNILHLIKMWLKAPVMIDGRPTGGKKKKIGTPQGGVISPLLSNIYLHLLDRAVKRVGGQFQKYGIRIVRYADDFVLMAKRISKESEKYLRKLLARMKLELNEEKSRKVDSCRETFDFLGFTYRYSRDLYGHPTKKYWNVEPSKKSQRKVRSNLREYLKRKGHSSPEQLVRGINSITRGWMNYFSIQKVSYPQKAKRNLRYYLSQKLMRFYERKSQRKCKLYNQGAFKILCEEYGLIDPTKYARR